MPVSLRTALRNTRADAISTDAGASAKLRLYTAAYASMLVECVCNASAFAPAASGGVLTLNAISAGTAVATGTAAIARILRADGTTMVMEGLTVTAAGGGGNVEITGGVSITTGQTVSVSAATITEGNA
jgi:hypothetical protein